ncbi:hypothetical protein SD78_0387 [Bacillus badius]|nr:hypothetical protein SD78_0387 [Bacillus badius]
MKKEGIKRRLANRFKSLVPRLATDKTKISFFQFLSYDNIKLSNLRNAEKNGLATRLYKKDKYE